MILTTWLSCMSTYTSFRPEMIIFQQVSNVVWGHWIKKTMRFSSPFFDSYYYFILVKLRDIDMRHNNYNLPLRRKTHSIQVRMTLLLLLLLFFNWAMMMASMKCKVDNRIFIQSWMRQDKEREREKEKGYQFLHIYVCMYSVYEWWRLMVVFIGR